MGNETGVQPVITSYGAGGVVVGPQGTLVVVNQNHQSWSLPKGHIDEGENELEAARREIWEETGIPPGALTLECPLGAYQRYKIALDGGDDISDYKRITMFLFTTEHTALSPRDPLNPTALWLTPHEACERLTHFKDKEFLRSVLQSPQWRW